MTAGSFKCPECTKKLKTSNLVAGKKLRCPGCQALVTMPAPPAVPPPVALPLKAKPVPGIKPGIKPRAPQPARNSPQRQRIANDDYEDYATGQEADEESYFVRARPRRRTRGWWIAGAVVILAAAGVAAFFLLRGGNGGDGSETVTKIAPVWDKATAAKLTLLISEKHLSDRTLDFPTRDHTAALKRNLNDTLAAFGKNEFERGRLIGEAQAKKSGDYLEEVLYLFSDRETNWPKDNVALKLEVWGSRMPTGPGGGAFHLFDFKLEGRQQENGAFKGQAAGRLRVGTGGWITFENADFLLEPWTITERK